jgi:D-alanyl-D-alanine carboxypeptidase
MRILATLVLIISQLTGLVTVMPAYTHELLQQFSTEAPVQTAASLPASPLTPIPVQTGNASLSLGATAVYAVDTTTMTTLYAKNADAHLPIASITKMVTALIILKDHSPSDTVTIKNLPAYTADDEILGLADGQQFTVGDLLKATLIASDNDAADALAIYDAGSLTAFAAKMNIEMSKWGISDTHFASPEGLTDTNNYASARALAKIGKLLLAYPLAAMLVADTNATITDAAGASYDLTSTDDLLATGEFYGIKTGYTDAAGDCFVGITNINNHQIITVVLHSPDRFGESTNLRSWIESNWQWQ